MLLIVSCPFFFVCGYKGMIEYSLFAYKDKYTAFMLKWKYAEVTIVIYRYILLS